MKRFLLVLALILPSVAFSQTAITSPRLLVFNESAYNCKISYVDGHRYLAMADGNTVVKIDDPVNRGHGEFSVDLTVAQFDSGTAEVIPDLFSVQFSDPDHTKFAYVDRDSEIDHHAKKAMWANIIVAGMAGAAAAQPQTATVNNSNGTTSTVTYTDPAAQQRANEQAAESGRDLRRSVREAKSGILHRNTVEAGASVSGTVFFREPKGSNLKIKSKDRLFAVDIPINGTIFRFQ